MNFCVRVFVYPCMDEIANKALKPEHFLDQARACVCVCARVSLYMSAI